MILTFFPIQHRTCQDIDIDLALKCAGFERNVSMANDDPAFLDPGEVP
jgi:hypothetical protein